MAPATPDFVRTLGKSAEGVLGSSQWTPDVAGSDDWFGTAADYAAGFRAKFGHEADVPQRRGDRRLPGHGHGHRSGRIPSSRDKVRDALDELDVDTFFGPIQFRPDRQEHGQADVRHPDPGRQGRDGLADGVRSPSRCARRPRPRPTRAARRREHASRSRPSTASSRAASTALVGVGFSLVWGVTNIVNLAHGALVVGGAYIAWELQRDLRSRPAARDARGRHRAVRPRLRRAARPDQPGHERADLHDAAAHVRARAGHRERAGLDADRRLPVHPHRLRHGGLRRRRRAGALRPARGLRVSPSSSRPHWPPSSDRTRTGTGHPRDRDGPRRGPADGHPRPPHLRPDLRDRRGPGRARPAR